MDFKYTVKDKKDLPMDSGVYAVGVRNVKEKYVYVGSSCSMKSRISPKSHPYFRAILEFGYDNVYMVYTLMERGYSQKENELIQKYRPMYNKNCVPIENNRKKYVLSVFKPNVKEAIKCNTELLKEIGNILATTPKCVISMILSDGQILFHYEIILIISKQLKIPIYELYTFMP